MSWIQALLLGLVQGITEFLPVSSSGHLAVLKNLFQISKNTGLLFDVIVHLGTLGAIFAAFRRELKKLFLEGCRSLYDFFGNFRIYFRNRHEQEARRYKKVISNNYRKLFYLLLISTLPTAAAGIILGDLAEQARNNLLAPAVGFFITGILLLVVDFFPAGNKIPKDVNYGTALIIGICQGLAVFPGISRTGVTIAVCLLCGFNKKFAVKYSFLLAVPAILGAAVWELIQSSETATPELIGTYFLGAAAAGIVGYFCIHGMLVMIRRKRFSFFSVYCFAVGIAAVVCSFVL